MMDASTGTSATAETWVGRVAAWRASGKSADEFSRHEGYAASTLRWWASKLKREPTPAATEIRLARVVRTASPPPAVAASQSLIVVEVTASGARIIVDAGADRATLTMVLEVLGAGVTR